MPNFMFRRTPGRLVNDGNRLEWIEGTTEWEHQSGDKYLVTGTDLRGRRFSQTYSDWLQAKGVNIAKGSKWLLRNGKRHLISRAS